MLWNGDLRLLADGFAGERLRGRLNILQNVRRVPEIDLPGGFAAADVERSALLFWQQHEGEPPGPTWSWTAAR